MDLIDLVQTELAAAQASRFLAWPSMHVTNSQPSTCKLGAGIVSPLCICADWTNVRSARSKRSNCVRYHRLNFACIRPTASSPSQANGRWVAMDVWFRFQQMVAAKLSAAQSGPLPTTRSLAFTIMKYVLVRTNHEFPFSFSLVPLPVDCAIPGRHADSTWSEHNCVHTYTHTLHPKAYVSFTPCTGQVWVFLRSALSSLPLRSPNFARITLPDWNRRMHLIVLQSEDGVYFRISFAAGECEERDE